MIVILLLSLIPSFFSTQVFSQNRVIVKDFNWKIYKTDNVDLYHYADSDGLLEFAEKFIKDAERRAAYLKPNFEHRIPLFIYSSQNDFEQSTIANITEGVGGLAEAFKNRLLVGHLGSVRRLNHLIVHEYVHAVQYSVLFGGWWRSARLLKFIFYPLWLMEGMAEYSSGDLDIPEREMYVRDAVLNNRGLSIIHLHNFGHLEPHQITLAYKTSELLMRFIAEEYGEEKIEELLRVYAENYDANTVLKIVLGLELHMLDFKFKEFLNERYETYKSLNKPIGERLTKSYTKYPTFNFSPAMTPDGENLFYLSDNRGKTEIWQKNLISGKSTLLINKNKFEHINSEGRALSVSPDGNKIIFVAERKQKDFIVIYDIKKRRYIKKMPPLNYSSLATPSFFSCGNKIAFSAMVESFRDIYIYDLKTEDLQRITIDRYDDIDPIVSPDGKYMVYSSERLRGDDLWDYNLFMIDLNTRMTERLTDMEWDELNPSFSPDGKRIIFRGEPDTVRNLYSMDLEKKEVLRLTSSSGGIFNPVYSPDGAYIFCSLFLDGRKDIYKIKSEELYAVERPELSEIQKETETGHPPSTEVRNITPYKFRASTDLFYPFLYYSSLDGLFLATYLQFSDMLSHHNFQMGVLYADHANRLSYIARYTFTRFRPQFVLGLSGDNMYYDWINDKFARYDEIILGMSYPLDRFKKIDIMADIVFNKFVDGGKTDILRDDILNITYTHNSVSRKYLEPITGNLFRASGILAMDSFGGATRKQSISVENSSFFQLTGEFVCLWRMFVASTFDRDSGHYSLGGDRMVRGFPYGSVLTKSMLVNNIELRLPVVSNINYYVWYMFPDFYFKSFFATLFIDSGVGYDSGFENFEKVYSFGAGLKLYSFIIQTFPLVFKIECAKPFSPEPSRWYFSIGSFFY